MSPGAEPDPGANMEDAGGVNARSIAASSARSCEQPAAPTVKTRRPDPDILATMRFENRSVQEMAGRVGLSTSSVYSWMARYGIKRRPPARRLAGLRADVTEDPSHWLTQAQLIELWDEGRCDIKAIAALTELPPAVVRDRLIAAGVLPQPRPSDRYQTVGDPDDPLPRHVLEDLYVKRGLTPSEIGELTGTTREKVFYRLRAYGIPRRRPGLRDVLKDLTPERLAYLYCDEHMSAPEIAEILNCSIPSVVKRLHGYGIAVDEGKRRPRRRGLGRSPVNPTACEVRDGDLA